MVQACTDFMIQKVTKYRDIEKRSATLMKLRSGKTVKPATSRAYVGKGRVLVQKEVDQGIAKLVQRKGEEQVGAAKRAEKVATKKAADDAKAIADAEYQAACDAALAGGLPKPKRPRAPRKPKAVGAMGVATKGGASGKSSSRGGLVEGVDGSGSSRGGRQVATETNVVVCNDSEELDEMEIEEQRRVEQIQEFFEVCEDPPWVGGSKTCILLYTDIYIGP